MNKLLELIADILIPKSKEIKTLEEMPPHHFSQKIPRTDSFDFETNSLRVFFSYKDKLCRQAIWEIKYRANQKLIRSFSLLLYESILEEISDLQTFNNFRNIVLLPVPSSKARFREKGFNQCILICRELIKIDRERNQTNFTLHENLLIKKVDTPHQTKVHNRNKRLENLKGSFEINKKYLPLNSNSYILIDDVITTGATMKESFRALREVGARKIIGFALAH